MKSFLREPWFWIRETLRGHWREVLKIVLIVWGGLTIGILVLGLFT